MEPLCPRHLSALSYVSSGETLKTGDLQCKEKDTIYYSAGWMLPICPCVTTVFSFPTYDFKRDKLKLQP